MWLSKAESLLNNIDQKAAKALKQSNSFKLGSSSSLEEEKSVKTKVPTNHDENKHNNRLLLSEEHLQQQQQKIQKQQIDGDHFDDAETELNELKIENENLKLEIENFRKEKNEHDFENLYQILIDEKRDITLINQSLENANADYIKKINELENYILKQKDIRNKLEQKVKHANNELESLNSDFQNYKTKALNQLSLKEKLIEQLKCDKSENNEEENAENFAKSSYQQMQIEELINERDYLKEEMNSLTKKLESSKLYIENLEVKNSATLASYEEKISKLNDDLNGCKQKITQKDDKVRLNKLEMERLREEKLKEKTLLLHKLHEKENELKQIRSYNSTDTEMESRLAIMTDSLIAKQNNLEMITKENNLLKLQYEKLSVSSFHSFKLILINNILL
jgi:hypothetical protein